MRIKYLSAYLCSQYDYHKKTALSSDNFDYIKSYYESIVDLDLEAVIIVDNISDDFIKKYSNKNVTFYRQPRNISHDHMQLHDIRFVYFMDYIIRDKCIDGLTVGTIDGNDYYYMISDVSDVVILNPVQNIINIDPHTLYVGTENQNLLDNTWFNHKFFNKSVNQWLINNPSVSDYQEVFVDRVILNCGIIFGCRELLIEFLNRFVELSLDIYGFAESFPQNISLSIVPKETSLLTQTDCHPQMGTHRYPIDMFVVNYVSYKYYGGVVYDGGLLNTRFGAYLFDTTKCVKHK